LKPPPFDYVRADSVGGAVRALSSAEGDGKILAGGQSLVPMMALRVARPSLLVDINRIPGLSGIGPAPSPAGDGPAGDGPAEEGPAAERAVRVGALTRHCDLARQRDHPLLAEAACVIGHPAIRSRGTVGGSIAHADPAAELPVVAAALDAVAHIARPGPSPGGTGPGAGAGACSSRDIAAAELYLGPLETVLADDELITSVTFPVPRRWGFAEFARRRGDFALVIVVAAEAGGRIRIAAGGVGGVPYRATEAEAVLAGAVPPGGPVAPEVIDRAAASAGAEVPASGDLHGSAEFRRAMAAELTRRALTRLAGGPENGARR
jgi:carbon-monoxide dehydrogenase medium subunit